MHSFHRSRGRILFEVFCTLGVSASCAGAWMQTGASALLAAAAVAGLYGLVLLFDLRGPKAAVAADVAATDDQGDLLDYLDTVEPPPVLDGKPEIDEPADESESAESIEEPEPAEAIEEPEPAEAIEEPEPAEPAQSDEADRSPIAPLFEPEPLVRTKRAVFGRKAG